MKDDLRKMMREDPLIRSCVDVGREFRKRVNELKQNDAKFREVVKCWKSGKDQPFQEYWNEILDEILASAVNDVMENEGIIS